MTVYEQVNLFPYKKKSLAVGQAIKWVESVRINIRIILKIFCLVLKVCKSNILQTESLLLLLLSEFLHHLLVTPEFVILALLLLLPCLLV